MIQDSKKFAQVMMREIIQFPLYKVTLTSVWLARIL